MNILISACLLGINCRYDGTGTPIAEIIANLKRHHHLIPVCPEQLGGLCTPRDPVELIHNRAVTEDQADVTEQFVKGAREVLAIAHLYDCQYAILKERSPSCGSTQVYDGTFSGQVIEGQGLTALYLRQNGLIVLSEEQIPEFL